MKHVLSKIIALMLIGIFALQPVAPIFAQEATDSAVTTQNSTSTPTVGPTNPPATPTASPSTIPTQQPSSTPTPSVAVSPTQIPSPSPTFNLSSPTPTSSTTPTISPTLTPQVMPGLTDSPQSLDSATIRQPAKLRTLSKHDFRSNEKVTVVVDNVTSSEITAVLLDNIGQNVEVEMEEIESGSFTIIRITPPLSFKPGKYKLMISGPNNQSWQQDFSWGVLAINTNKSIYLPNETVKLAMAVLDETGMMVCDAKLELKIKNQELVIDDLLSTENSRIKVNPECQIKDFTLKPDYEAEYQVGEVGSYGMILTARTKNGTFTITDAFEVRESVSFDVERVTATRIYPPSTYPVTFNILANEDFEGEIEETVPESFAISPATGPLRSYDDLKAVTAKIKSDDLLQAAIANIGLPFNGQYPTSLGFGQNLVDPQLKNLYEKYGLAGHDGIDFDMPLGTPVLAVDDGEVVKVQASGDYGDTIVIKHQWGKSYYGHLSKFEVSQGQKVLKGDKIALSGNTGLSTAPHLHFGIKPQNSDSDNGYFGKINPATFLGLQDGTLTTPVKVISWKVKVQKGDTLTLGYQFKAPNVSPEFYKLGSLKFIDQNNTLIFEEARLWQLAADAVAFDAATLSEGAGSRTFNHTITGANPALLVFVSSGKGTIPVVTGVTYAGTALTFVRKDTNGTDAQTEIWKLAAPATGTNSVVVTVTGAPDPVFAAAVSFTGADQTNPVSNHNGATGANSPATVAVTSATGEIVADGYAQVEGNAATIGAGQTKRWGTASVEPGSEGSTEAGASSVTMSWTVSTAWAISAASIKPVGGAESPTQSQLMRHGKWFNAAGVEQPFTF